MLYSGARGRVTPDNQVQRAELQHSQSAKARHIESGLSEIGVRGGGANGA
jgi:hypothetical protein